MRRCRNGPQVFLSLQPKRLKVTELRAVLGQRGLRTGGKKDELIARLEQASSRVP